MDFNFLNGIVIYSHLFFQLLLAMVLGIMIGLERNHAHKTAGMRTYALVSMGACLFIVVTGIVTSNFSGLTNFDPLRTMAAIIMGIGFIAGGAIMQSARDSQVHGLTTSAGIWMATGIGITVGFSLYTLAIIATLLTLFVLSTLAVVEHWLRSRPGGTKED